MTNLDSRPTCDLSSEGHGFDHESLEEARACGARQAADPESWETGDTSVETGDRRDDEDEPVLCAECGIFPVVETTVGGVKHLCQQCLDRVRRSFTEGGLR